MNIRETQFEILQALGRYKYLTASLTLKALNRKDKSTIWKHYRELISLKMVEQKKFPISPKYGQVEGVYYLTKKGVIFLQNHIDENREIKYPKGQQIFAQDYHHRMATISFNIELTKTIEELNGEIEYFIYYFDKTGSNRGGDKRLTATAKIETELGFVIPDGVAKININNRDLLFLFEQQNGHNTKELIHKIKALAKVLAEGGASKKFNFNKSPRVVFSLENKSLFKALYNRQNEIHYLEAFKKFFVFQITEDIESGGILQSWLTWDGQPAEFLPGS